MDSMTGNIVLLGISVLAPDMLGPAHVSLGSLLYLDVILWLAGSLLRKDVILSVSKLRRFLQAMDERSCRYAIGVPCWLACSSRKFLAERWEMHQRQKKATE